jgi:hypothetical protein
MRRRTFGIDKATAASMTKAASSSPMTTNGLVSVRRAGAVALGLSCASRNSFG